MQNLLRGTGLKGLSGINGISKLNNLNIYRPFIAVEFYEINKYAVKNEVPYLNDSSNLKNEYTRNNFRNNIIPLLRQINPRAEAHIYDVSQIISTSQHIIYEYLSNIKSKVVNTVNENTFIDIKLLNSLTQHVEYFLFDFLLQHNFSKVQIQNIISSTNANANTSIIKSKNTTYVMCYNSNTILVSTIEAIASVNMELTKNELVKNNLSPLVFKKIKATSFDLNAIPVNNFPDKIVYRTLQNGDYINPLGMKGKRKLVSRMLIDKKLAAIEKKQVKVLAIGSEVYLVLGISKSEKWKYKIGDEIFIF